MRKPETTRQQLTRYLRAWQDEEPPRPPLTDEQIRRIARDQPRTMAEMEAIIGREMSATPLGFGTVGGDLLALLAVHC